MTSLVQEYSPVMQKLFKAAASGVYGISSNTFTEAELTEAKNLGCFIPDRHTITWGGLHVFGTFADTLYRIAAVS